MVPAKIPYLYEYPFDLTPYVEAIKGQTVGQLPTQALVDAIAKVSGDPWTLAFQQKYTMYGAKVFYLGPNLPEFATSKRYKYVVGIELSTWYFSKRLYFVFNVL